MNPPTTTDIPTPIVEAAKAIDVWFKRQGITDWELLNICSRQLKFTLERENLINLATKNIEIAALTQQHDELKEEVFNLQVSRNGWEKAAEIEQEARLHLVSQNDLLEKTICELRCFLDDVVISLEGDVDGSPGASGRSVLANQITHDVNETLSKTPSEISEKWVNRDVLENTLKAAQHMVNCDYADEIRFRCKACNESVAALNVARTELGKGEK